MATYSGFMQLPPELLIYIAKELSNSDLNTFRLLTRIARDIADPFRFDTVTFSIQDRHRKDFLSICSHPKYRFMVKTLNYSVTTIHPPSRQGFKSLLKASKRTLSEEDETQLYNHFVALSKRAQTTPVWRVIDLLYSGLKQLPNVKTVAIVQDRPGRSGWYRELPWLASAYESCKAHNQQLRMYWRGDPVAESNVYWTDLDAIMYAVKNSGAQIQEFTIYQQSDGLDAHRYNTPYLRTGWPYYSFDNIMPYKMFVSRLVKLSLALNGFDCALPILPDLLYSAALLQHLEIDCRTDRIPGGSVEDMYDAIDCAFRLRHNHEEKISYDPPVSVVIPNLRSLSISNSLLAGWRLFRVIEDHEKLETLTLRNLHHHHQWPGEAEDWESILDVIKSKNLKSVTLDNISGFVREITPTTMECITRMASDKYVAEVKEYHAQQVWSQVPLWRGKMPLAYKRREWGHIKNALVEWLDSQPLRDYIRRDRQELDRLVMEYVNGKLEINPLVGLKIHDQLNWRWDDIYAKVLTVKD